MKALHLLWHAGVDTRHRTKYWNTRYRQMYWINGDDTGDEPVTPEEKSCVEIGYEGTADDARILDRLNELSHEEFTFDLING